MSTVLERWLSRLRESDTQTRREAIRQLEILGDERALGALAQVFALDPDLDTRKLAQQVGKSIYWAADKRSQPETGPSDAERQRALEILAKAQSKRGKK